MTDPITTREFVFEQQTYLRLHLRPFLKVQMLVLYGLTALAWLVILLAGLDGRLVCGLLLVTSVPLWPFAGMLLLLGMSLPQNREFFTHRRFYTMDEQQITVHEEDGSVQPVPWSQIARVEGMDRAYLLYAPDGALTYLPHDIFQSPEDRTRFEELIHDL